jgi:hypothetical protein
MSWSTQATARTKAPPEQVWKLWADVAGWSRWDDEVASSRLEGDFAVGTRGSLKPKGGPTTSFVLTHVEPNVAFSNRSSLPLATLEFVHTLRVEAGETVIEHRAEMKGPLTVLFRRLIGANIARGLPAAVARLARVAEERSA